MGVAMIESRFFLLVALAVFAMTGFCQWAYDVLIFTVPDTDSIVSDNLIFGTDLLATDGFDEGIDLLAPPPPPDAPNIIFATTNPMLTGLTTDFRSSNADTLIWQIIITSHHPVFVEWTPEMLPAYEGCIYSLQKHYPGVEPDWSTAIDMRTENHLDLLPAEYVDIRFVTIDGFEESQVKTRPSAIEIESITPNPFNSAVQISANVGGTNPVDVSIHDTNGRLVFKNHIEPSGSSNVNLMWDGCDFGANPLPTGVYLVKIVSGDSKEACRLILMR